MQADWQPDFSLLASCLLLTCLIVLADSGKPTSVWLTSGLLLTMIETCL